VLIKHSKTRIRKQQKPKHTMPNIILKKTFKIKPAGFQVAAEKSFSFYGAVSAGIVETINDRIQNNLKVVRGANKPVFKLDNAGHYFAEMNHQTQKYHEEDVIVLILDAMEGYGWSFRFQYDLESESVKIGGSSYTRRECFIFHK